MSPLCVAGRATGSHSLVVTVEEPAELFITQTYISGTKALFLIITLGLFRFLKELEKTKQK